MIYLLPMIIFKRRTFAVRIKNRNRMKTLIISLGVFLPCATTYGQGIKGKIVDENNRPIEYANIVLLAKADSSFVAGAVSDANGAFYMNYTNETPAIVKFSYMGFTDKYQSVEAGATDLGVITLDNQSTELDEVTITAHKAVFKQKGSSLVTDVAGSLLSEYHDMTDMLSRIPGIVRTVDGGYQVFGKGAPIIYIDNRKVQDESEMQQLDPKNIKTVELIKNPGARYDAEGKAVLKITTIKRDEGWGITAKHESAIGERYSSDQYIRLNAKKGGLSFSAYYEYEMARSEYDQPSSQELTLNDQVHRYDNNVHRKQDAPIHTWRANVDYEFNKDHIAGFKVNGSSMIPKLNTQGVLNTYLNDAWVESRDLLDGYKNKTLTNQLNAFYNATWNDYFSSELNLDYVRNKNEYDQSVTERNEQLDITTNSDAIGYLDIYAGQFTINYAKDNWLNFSVGADYNQINNKSALTISSDAVPSSDYKETEKRYAGFVEWNFQAGNFAGNVGVRYEKMKMKYADFLNPEQSFDRDFDNVFPSVSLSHQMGAWANSLSFATRTSRPSFRQLSNSTYYQNEFFYQQGNPLLKPATSYNIQWGTSYQFLYFSLGYTRTKDYLEDTFENVQEAVISTFANFKKHQVLNADLNLQYAFGLWSPSLYLGVAKPFFEVDYLGEKVKYNQPQYTIVTSHDFSFPKDITLSAYYMFMSAGDDGTVSFTKPVHMLNLTLKKDFFDKKLSVSLKGYDIFHTTKYKERMHIGNVAWTQTEDYNMWNYSISLIYRFNQKIKSKYRGKSTVEDDVNRL